MKGNTLAKDETETTPEKTPRERFVKSATIRTNAALEAIAKLGKLGTDTYEYTEDDVEKICAVLTAKVEKVREILLGDAEDEAEFSLD